MNFCLEIADPGRLVVSWEPGCENAVQLQGAGPPLPAQPPTGGPQASTSAAVLQARISRDPGSGRLLLRLSCGPAASASALDNTCTAIPVAPRVSAIDNGRLTESLHGSGLAIDNGRPSVAESLRDPALAIDNGRPSVAVSLRNSALAIDNGRPSVAESLYGPVLATDKGRISVAESLHAPYWAGRISVRDLQQHTAPTEEHGRISYRETAVVESDDSDDNGDAAYAAKSSLDDAEESERQGQRDPRATSVPTASIAGPSYASALDEFVATERTYVRRLGLVFNQYYQGLVAAVQARQIGCCGVDELRQVFGHFEGMRLLHEQLMADLRQKPGSLGQVMCQYAQQLKSYSTYYSMFQQITSKVRGWMTDEAFGQAFGQLRAQHAEPAEAQLDLRALLLEPVQRPMRYPMLLGKYLAEIGPDHPDWPGARRAADSVRDILLELEKSLRDFSAFQDRLQLLRSVAFPTSLASLWEEFAHSCLRHGRARRGDKPHYLLLSRHTLLICKPVRFRQEVWAAKRAVPVPGDLRVLGCEGNRLRMDTASDPQLLLLFGDGQEASADAAGVRECRDWAAELRKLGVPFVDCPGDADDRQLPWERAARRAGRPVMTPLDKEARCQACGQAHRPLRRRQSCRVCGGAFCADCTDYQTRTAWGGDRPLRCCLFCRAATPGAGPADLASDRHRDLLARFLDVRAQDDDPSTLAGHLTAWLSGRWVPVWCRADPQGRRLSLYRHRRDFLPVLSLVSPRGAAGGGGGGGGRSGGGGDEDGESGQSELVVHDHANGRGCRLRAAAVADAGSQDGLLERLAAHLLRCEMKEDEADMRGGLDLVDGGTAADQSATPEWLAPVDSLELMPEQ